MQLEIHNTRKTFHDGIFTSSWLILTFLIMRQPHVHDFSLPFWIFEHRIIGSCLIGWNIFNHGWLFWCWRKLASWFWFFISTLRLPLILEMQEFSLACFVSRSYWKTNFNHRRPWRSKIFHVFQFCQQFYKKLSCQLLTLTHSYRTISANTTVLHISKICLTISLSISTCLVNNYLSSQQPSPFPHAHQFSLLLDSDVTGYFPHSFMKDLLCHWNTLDFERASSPYASRDILKVLVALFISFKRDLNIYSLPFFFNQAWTQQDGAWFSMWIGEGSSITSIHYRILHTRWLFFKRKTYRCQ
jgi:hypothetical protein